MLPCSEQKGTSALGPLPYSLKLPAVQRPSIKIIDQKHIQLIQLLPGFWHRILIQLNKTGAECTVIDPHMIHIGKAFRMVAQNPHIQLRCIQVQIQPDPASGCLLSFLIY